uniref:Uncharacterized protein n=1 Tax=viral metagenome TaxID=1070528 RepID=A0A6H1ZLE9_9ZZZZ
MKQPIPIFEGLITPDHTVFYSDHVQEDRRRWLATFKPGARVDETIKKHRKDRTLLQNAYYFGVVLPILAKYFGHDNTEDMHEDLKLEFNPVESKIEPGKKIGGTTTKMSTEEFMASETSYVERICRWAATEHGLYIPPPKKAEKA